MSSHPLLTTLFLSACYDARFNDCSIQCSPDTGCPDGLVCGNEGLCRSASASCPITPHLSCANLPAICGADAHQDCCASSIVPGGTFFRSHDVAADGAYPSTMYPATVSTFTLDTYEVTVGRFRAFVIAGMGTRLNPPLNGVGARPLNGSTRQGGWDPAWNTNLMSDDSTLEAALRCDAAHQTWTDAPGANDALPINCVSWYEAFAFCAWDGGFLPTEAEWNYAAAGGGEQRAYPWSVPAGSVTIDCTYANYDACGGMPKRVGSASPKGDGKWGQADLIGNAWEWSLDWSDPYSTPCANCSTLTSGTLRVNRGGAFGFSTAYARASFRGAEMPTLHLPSIGIRCAK